MGFDSWSGLVTMLFSHFAEYNFECDCMAFTICP